FILIKLIDIGNFVIINVEMIILKKTIRCWNTKRSNRKQNSIASKAISNFSNVNRSLALVGSGAVYFFLLEKVYAKANTDTINTLKLIIRYKPSKTDIGIISFPFSHTLLKSSKDSYELKN
ncbi:hypothetical protein, partial [Robertmurraya massiliosenegalensis]